MFYSLNRLKDNCRRRLKYGRPPTAPDGSNCIHVHPLSHGYWHTYEPLRFFLIGCGKLRRQNTSYLVKQGHSILFDGGSEWLFHPLTLTVSDEVLPWVQLLQITTGIDAEDCMEQKRVDYYFQSSSFPCWWRCWLNACIMMKILLLLLLDDVVDDAYGDAALNIIIIHSFSFTIHHASYHRQATTKDVFFWYCKASIKIGSRKVWVLNLCANQDWFPFLH